MAAKLAGRQGLHPRGLPRPDAGDPQDGPDRRKLLGMMPGMGADEGADQQHRRAGDRPHRRDHPVDDPGRAPGRRRSSTAPAGPASPSGSGVEVADGQQPRRPVLRGAQDDGPDGPGRRHAGDARDARAAGMGGGVRRSRRTRHARRRPGGPATPRSVRSRSRLAAAAGQPDAGRGPPDLPKDFELPERVQGPPRLSAGGRFPQDVRALAQWRRPAGWSDTAPERTLSPPAPPMEPLPGAARAAATGPTRTGCSPATTSGATTPWQSRSS